MKDEERMWAQIFTADNYYSRFHFTKFMVVLKISWIYVSGITKCEFFGISSKNFRRFNYTVIPIKFWNICLLSHKRILEKSFFFLLRKSNITCGKYTCFGAKMYLWYMTCVLQKPTPSTFCIPPSFNAL